jgi:hypothetical protein
MVQHYWCLSITLCFNFADVKQFGRKYWSLKEVDMPSLWVGESRHDINVPYDIVFAQLKFNHLNFIDFDDGQQPAEQVVKGGSSMLEI